MAPKMTSEELQQVARLAEWAKQEDLGAGDRTSLLLDSPDERAEFRLISKAGGVLAGCEVTETILAAYGEGIEFSWVPGMTDGAKLPPDDFPLATMRGRLDSILAAERVLLNFLQRLCGIATVTSRYVDAIAHTSAEVFDTRKTTPGWRVLEKYAVRCGGGRNHRMGLYDAVLIKDNHLVGVGVTRLASVVFEMLNKLSADKDRPTFVEVEADDLAQMEALLDVVGIDVILLDNFKLDELRRAVRLRDDRGLRAKVALEASGGITLATASDIAETGVERLSVGAITHSAPALDLSLERVG